MRRDPEGGKRSFNIKAIAAPVPQYIVYRQKKLRHAKSLPQCPNLAFNNSENNLWREKTTSRNIVECDGMIMSHKRYSIKG